MDALCFVLTSGLNFSAAYDVTESENDSVWDSHIIRPDGVPIYRAKRTEFRAYESSSLSQWTSPSLHETSPHEASPPMQETSPPMQEISPTHETSPPAPEASLHETSLRRHESSSQHESSPPSHEGSSLYNVVFLTLSMKLYKDKNVSEKAITSMWNSFSQTKHLQEVYQKGSKSFEVALGWLDNDEYEGNRPVIYSYIFNVETERLSWPGEGIDIWDDPVIGWDSFHADRTVDIGMWATSSAMTSHLNYPGGNTLEKQMWLHRRTFPLCRLPRERYSSLQKKIVTLDTSSLFSPPSH